MFGWKLSYKWRVFLHGAFNSIVGAIAGNLSLMIVDPADFNPFSHGDWSKIGAQAGATAFIGLILYLKTHPLPDPEKDTDAAAVADKAIAVMENAKTSSGTGDGGPPRIV